MKTNLTPTGACRLEICSSPHESFTAYHVTATLDTPTGAGAAAQQVFASVAAALAEHRIQPVQEKLYGLTRGRDEVLRVRDGIYRGHGLDRTMPVTWIEGAPLHGGEFTGVQIWGVAPTGGEPCVRTVENPVTGRGRVWTGAGFRMLHLPGVCGTRPDGVLAATRVEQAAQMFANVGAGLAAHDMRYPQVVRTWIYVAHLLDWYLDMNRVRTAHYRANGLGVEGGPAFPASTGIMGRSGAEECIMDVLAVESLRPGALVATPINRSAKQHSSFNYGSSFSRAMALEIEGRRTVHVSGTASINAAGSSTHRGDAEHQCIDTLLSIAAILEDQGGGLGSIVSATLFCKDTAPWEAWERTTRLLKVPAIPKVTVVADVCRDDLLVEMEAVAVI
jgi:enamine deaminase RidA (YjgF/YER057c/UK114 family)